MVVGSFLKVIALFERLEKVFRYYFHVYCILVSSKFIKNDQGY